MAGSSEGAAFASGRGSPLSGTQERCKPLTYVPCRRLCSSQTSQWWGKSGTLHGCFTRGERSGRCLRSVAPSAGATHRGR